MADHDRQTGGDNPRPDPGNSPPEDWTEDLDPDEIADVMQILNEDKS